jgi:hypothetical protein
MFVIVSLSLRFGGCVVARQYGKRSRRVVVASCGVAVVVTLSGVATAVPAQAVTTGPSTGSPRPHARAAQSHQVTPGETPSSRLSAEKDPTPSRWRNPKTGRQETDWVAQQAEQTLRLAKPSWAQGAFREQVEEIDAPLAAVFAHGRGAYVEMAVPTNVRDVPTERDKSEDGYRSNDRTRRLAQGWDRYGLENLGGGKVRIIQSGTTIAEGRLDDPRVQAWWKPLLTHTRWALKPGTGRDDLARVEQAFPDRPTHLTVGPAPLTFRTGYYPSPRDLDKDGTVLVPRDAQLSPVAGMVLRDRLLQHQPVDPRVLVDVAELADVERVFDARFQTTPLVELTRKAATTTGRKVFGLSATSPGAGRAPVLHTVGAVDGNLVLFDEAGDYHHPTEALMSGRSVNLLRTTGTARLQSRPVRTPAELSTTTWTFAPHLDDATRLAEQLGPNETLDVIRTYALGVAPMNNLYPEMLRITRTATPDHYRLIQEEGLERTEHAFTRAELRQFLTGRVTYGSATHGAQGSHHGVFLRRVDAHTPYPGVEGPADDNHLLSETVNPYRAWTVARPGTAPSPAG